MAPHKLMPLMGVPKRSTQKGTIMPMVRMASYWLLVFLVAHTNEGLTEDQGNGNIDSIASLQEKLEPIRKNVWGGKAIPFPIVIDHTFSNWERYAIQGLGDCLLIDPDGRMVRGDLDSLQQILDSGEPCIERKLASSSNVLNNQPRPPC